MAIDPTIRIDLAAEFTGKKAFTQADTSTQKLTKSVKTLAKGFLGVFAIQKLVSYSKASVKAFAEDDAAAKSLGITLKNLGLAYGSNVGTVNGFINGLEAQTGVLDDELRPAMDRFLRATNDVAKSQELLNLALDIAAGTGKSVTQVSQSLQKAYLGQTAAIGRLGVGISKAELANADFADIQEKLNKLFAGQATAAADSYQGSLNKLTVAGNNAAEIIGKGLVDALGILSGAGTIDPTVSAIDRIANSMANAAKETAKFIKVNQTLFSDLSFFKNNATIAEALRIKMGTGFTTPMTISSQDTQRADKIAADAAKAAAAKALAASKASAAAKIAADKKAAANKAKLDKAAAVLDIQKIQIAAALKGKISEEEKTRLLLMQAIQDGNGDKAEKLAKKLEEIQAKNAKIAADLLAIGAAKDPFSTWAGSLSLAIAALAKLGVGMSAITSSMIPGVTYNPSQNPDRNYDDKVAAAEKAAADKAAADKIAADAAAVLAAAGDKAAADAAAAAAAAALAILGIPGTTFNPGQNPDRNYDDKAAAEAAAAAALAASATNTSQSPINPNGTFGFSLPSYLQNSMPQSSSINIVIEGNVLDGDDFTNKVNDALLNANRQGLPRTAAGTLVNQD
jgi:hypothetical protein